MSLSSQQKPNEILADIKAEIRRATVDVKHPFRLMVLSTASNRPRSRYVVLRKFDHEAMQIVFYTDSRSAKIREINENQQVCLLLYNQRKKQQVIIQGTAILECGNEKALVHLNQIPESNRGDYSSLSAPGDELNQPSEGWAKDTHLAEKHFTVTTVRLSEIEILQLSRDGHLRLVFDAASNWKGRWINP